jgi:hypothetical protein
VRHEYQSLSEHDLLTLGHFARTDYGRVFLSLIQRIHDAEDARMKHRPRLSDTVRDDLRYQMGLVAGLKLVLSAPDEIANIIQSKGD